MSTLSHSYYMSLALELAKKGEFNVLPNPRVGCVIVKNGKIIGRGYHQKYGEKHAEVLAIEDALKNGYNLKNATLYVNLEPCCHFGKQPPCTDAIIKSGIKKVVIATKDPNPLVGGNGINILKNNGLTVITGVLQNEAVEINREFFKFHLYNIPYISVKVAQSLDAKIASPHNERFFFNADEENLFVHQLRQRYMAIMVSANTVIKDDPMLNARFGNILRQPVRIVVDSNLKIPPDCKIVNTAREYKTIVIYAGGDYKKEEILSKKGIELIKVEAKDGHVNLVEALKKLSELNIVSVLVEGGGNLNFALLKERLVDYWYSFVFNIFIGGQNTLTSLEGEGFIDFQPMLFNTKITQFSKSFLIEGNVRYV